MHVTSCKPALEHDKKPLSEHPQYELGKRFQAISWQYPLSIRATVDVRIEVDPVAYILEHRKEYEEFEPERGFQPWEKPMCFLTTLVDDAVQNIYTPFGGGRHISRESVDAVDLHEHPRWTKEMTEQLDAVLAGPPPAPEPDPNQGDLFE